MKQKEKIELMGKIVTINKMFIRRQQWENGGMEKIWYVANTKQITGWIIGFSVRQDGKSEIIGPDEGMEWKPKGKAHKVVLVAKWINAKPIPVPYDGFELGGEVPKFPCQEWNEEWKKDQHDIMKNHARDEKGRWIKGGYNG